MIRHIPIAGKMLRSWRTLGRPIRFRAPWLFRCIVAGFAITTAAMAQESAVTESGVRAQALFDEARILLREKRFGDACPKFAESYQLDAALGTLINLATCQELEGRLATAMRSYLAVIANAEVVGDSARKDIAQARVERLRPKISTLQFEIPDSMKEQPFVVRLDGIELSRAQLRETIPLDGGDHELVIHQLGHISQVEQLRLSPSDEHLVHSLSPLSLAVVLAPGPEHAASSPRHEGRNKLATDEARSAQPAQPMSKVRVGGVVLASLGVAAMAIGGYFGVSAYSLKEKSIEMGCDERNVCPGDSLAVRNNAIRAGNVANASFLAGGVLASSGFVLYILGQPHSANAARVSVAVSPNLQLHMRGHF